MDVWHSRAWGSLSHLLWLSGHCGQWMQEADAVIRGWAGHPSLSLPVSPNLYCLSSKPAVRQLPCYTVYPSELLPLGKGLGLGERIDAPPSMWSELPMYRVAWAFWAPCSQPVWVATSRSWLRRVSLGLKRHPWLLPSKEAALGPVLHNGLLPVSSGSRMRILPPVLGGLSSFSLVKVLPLPDWSCSSWHLQNPSLFSKSTQN